MMLHTVSNCMPPKCTYVPDKIANECSGIVGVPNKVATECTVYAKCIILYCVYSILYECIVCICSVLYMLVPHYLSLSLMSFIIQSHRCNLGLE